MGTFAENVEGVGFFNALSEAIQCIYYDMCVKTADFESDVRMKTARALKEKATTANTTMNSSNTISNSSVVKKDESTVKATTKPTTATENEKKTNSEPADDKKMEISEIVIKEVSSSNDDDATDDDIFISEYESANQLSRSEIESIMLNCQSTYNNIGFTDIKVVVASMLYTAVYITSEDFYDVIGKSDDNMLVANSLVYSWTGVPINPKIKYDKNVFNLFENPIDVCSIVSYIASMDKMSNSALIQSLADKTRALYTEYDRKRQEMSGVENPDPIVPIMFVNNNIIGKEENGITKTEKKNLERKFKGIINGRDHQFNKLKEMYELVISDNFGLRTYLIDKYTFGEGDYNVITWVNGSVYPISLTNDKNIICKMINNPDYVLSTPDIQQISKRLFFNGLIFAGYDMSNVNEIKKTVVETGNIGDDQRLNDKLMAILMIPWGIHIGSNLPRVRITNFNNINDFNLVCDDKVKVPAIDGFNQFITPITIKVNGNMLWVQKENVNCVIELNKNIIK